MKTKKTLDQKFLDAVVQMDFTAFIGLLTLLKIDVWHDKEIDFADLLEELMRRYEQLPRAQRRKFLRMAKAGKREKKDGN